MYVYMCVCVCVKLRGEPVTKTALYAQFVREDCYFFYRDNPRSTNHTHTQREKEREQHPPTLTWTHPSRTQTGAA